MATLATQKHYNMSDHKCKDTTVVVIDHNPHWTDAENESKEKFWMNRFRQNVMVSDTSSLHPKAYKFEMHSFIDSKILKDNKFLRFMQ